jgi:hypothetical protein
MSAKAALILAGGLFASVALYVFFTPYEQCVIAKGYTKEARISCSQLSVEATVSKSEF